LSYISTKEKLNGSKITGATDILWGLAGIKNASINNSWI